MFVAVEFELFLNLKKVLMLEFNMIFSPYLSNSQPNQSTKLSSLL